MPLEAAYRRLTAVPGVGAWSAAVVGLLALGDPDAQTKSTGNPPSYEAIRTRTGTFVEYATGEHEYYDLTNDPDELTNVYSLLSQEHREKLTSRLDSLEVCWGGPSCWWAATRPISR